MLKENKKLDLDLNYVFVIGNYAYENGMSFLNNIEDTFPNSKIIKDNESINPNSFQYRTNHLPFLQSCSSSLLLFNKNPSFAFIDDMTDLPVLASSSIRALRAISPP